MSRPYAAAALALFSLVIATGCGSPQRGPQVASPTNQVSWAQTMPTNFRDSLNGYGDGEAELKKITQKMQKYPDELKNPPWGPVGEVYEAADQAGASAGYAERAHENGNVQRFFRDGQEQIGNKVAGSASYAAKQKGCNADVGGAAIHGMKEGVEKELERKQRERNEAHQVIDRYEGDLGKPNVQALEKQADEIARASYLARIELEEHKLRIDAFLQDAPAARKTLEQAIAREKTYQGEAGRTAEQKKASAERLAAAEKAKTELDTLEKDAQAAKPQIDQRLAESRRTYDEALNGLRNAVKSKKK